MKFWHDNKLDQETNYDPKELAARFIQEVKDGYDLSRSRVSFSFAFRWWLTDPQGLNVVWDPDDEDELFEALDDTLTREDRNLLWEKLTEGLPA